MTIHCNTPCKKTLKPSAEKLRAHLPTQAQNIILFLFEKRRKKAASVANAGAKYIALLQKSAKRAPHLVTQVQNISLFCGKPQKNCGRTCQCRRKIYYKKGRTHNAIHPLPLNFPHRLSAEFQALNQRVVSVERSALEIVEQLPAAACHSDKPAARMEVFLIC